MNARTATFAGTWKGFYSYGGPGNIYDFTLEIDLGNEDSITGTILEKDHTEPLEIAGYVHAPVVRFYKVSVNKKSVRYFEPFEFQGFLSSDGLHVSGSWTNASARGDWSAEKSEIPSAANGHDESTEAQAGEVNIDAVMNAPAYEEAPQTTAGPANGDENGLVPVDAPVESWVPYEEPGHGREGGLAGAFKARLQDHNATNVHSFFSVDPMQGESDLEKKVETNNESKGYASLPPAITADEKSDDSGSFVDDSAANQSAFAVDPLQGEPDIFKAVAEARNKDATYGGSAPALKDEDKLVDAGTFISKSEANKSSFMVDPIAGELNPAKALPSSPSTYAANTGLDALDYGVDTKDTANSAVIHDPDSNHSSFMVDPIGNELELLKNAGVVSPVTPPAPPDTMTPEPNVLAGSPPTAMPEGQLNSNSPSTLPSTICPRCGAERGGFSFCMGCGHSFDLSE
jgi:hypothetical protein